MELAVNPLGLQPVHRSLIAESLRKVAQIDNVSARAMHTKQWRSGPLGENRDQRRPAGPGALDRVDRRIRNSDAELVGDELGAHGDGRRAEQCFERKIDPQRLLDSGEQSDRKKRVAAQLEEIVVYTDFRDAQECTPQSR